MDTGNRSFTCDEATRRLIRRWARRLVGKAGLTRDDLPDLEQELALALCEGMPKYRPERASRATFMSRLARNAAAGLVETRRASKRGNGQHHVSLYDTPDGEDGEGPELHETLSVDDYLRRTRGTVRTEQERVDLALDVNGAILRLPAAERAVCLLLIDMNTADVARTVGIPRSTLYGVIHRIRQVFREVGLHPESD